MLEGGNIRITPSWVPQPTILDIQWDPARLSDAIPTGKFWGDLAYLGGTGSNEGQWEWRRGADEAVVLFTPVVIPGNANGYRRMVASLDGMSMPPRRGASGMGRIFYGISAVIPGTPDLTFRWDIP